MDQNIHDAFLRQRYCGYLWGESPSRTNVFDLAKNDLMNRQQTALALGSKTDGSPIKTESLLLAIELTQTVRRDCRMPYAMTHLQRQITYTDADMMRRPIEPICAFQDRLKTRQVANDTMVLCCFKYDISQRQDVELSIRKIDDAYRNHYFGNHPRVQRCGP